MDRNLYGQILAALILSHSDVNYDVLVKQAFDVYNMAIEEHEKRRQERVSVLQDRRDELMQREQTATTTKE